MLDYILNGRVRGRRFSAGPVGRTVSQMIANDEFDPNLLRPWVERVGKSPITEWCQVFNGFDDNGEPEFEVRPARLVTNTPATLPRDTWKLIDTTVREAALPQLRAVAQLRGAGLQYVIPNGMGVMALESMTGTDITGATVSMEGVRRGDRDQPEFDVQLLPLPIIHKDFSFPARALAVSRRSGNPFDTRTAAKASRKVAEEVEKLTLGTSAHSGYGYGGGAVYGLTDHPDRMTKTLTLPTAANWTPNLFISEVLAMIAQAKAVNYTGPYRLQLSSDWDQYLDNDYSQTYGGETLRTRLAKTDRLVAVETLDYLPAFTAVLTQQTADVIRIVIGMDVVTLQWGSNGDMEQNFKVMCIMVPQIMSDSEGNTGIVHGLAA